MQLPQFQVHADIEEHHWWFLGKRDLIGALLREVLRESTDPFILDAGCGTGGSTAWLHRSYRCVGIDPIPEAIAFARERFPAVTFRVGAVPQDCGDLLASADAVLLLDVLEHVEDDFLFTSSILAGMKPGAILLLMAPHDPALWGPHDRGFEHYRRCTLPRLRMLWEGLPVTELLCSACNARLYPLAKLSRFLTRLLGRSFGPSSTDLSLPPTLLNRLFRAIFGGESVRLLRALRGQGRGYRHGVSAIALLRREQGAIVPRRRPALLPPDPRPWMS